MYFYCFDINHSINIYQSHHKSQSWDIILYNHKYYLNLWETISRPEQWATTIHFDQETIIKWVCNNQTIKLLHWMVNERFSSYNKCIHLFFWNNIATLLKHKKIISDSKKNKQTQHLVVFPSVFSLTQYTSSILNSEFLILNGQSSDVAKAKAYRMISNNEKHILYTTHSQIFQNWTNLQSITIVDEYSPLYQTYQEPRYNLWTVVIKMREIYNLSNS